MKKLFLVLALLILGSFASQGAFAAVTYPSCYDGGNINNGTDKDRWSVHGWCVDDYGVLTPQTGFTTSSTYPNTQGGIAYPVINIPGPYSTYDSLISQNTGNTIIDMGGVISNGGTAGSGGVYILPAASKGEDIYVIAGSKSTITVDTLATTDTILFSTSVITGDGLKNSSATTADSLELISPANGFWIVKSVFGTWVGTGKPRG